MSYNIPKLIPLRKNDPSRFMVWIFSFVVYLTILTLTTVLILENALKRWSIDDTSSLTIQLMPAQNISDEDQVDKARKVLEEIREIKDIYVLNYDTIKHNKELVKNHASDNNVFDELRKWILN